MFLNTKVCKVAIEIRVEKVEGLPDKIKDKPFRIEYKRGSKNGISRSYTMSASTMMINYSFKLESSLSYEQKRGKIKFADKTLSLEVVAEKCKDLKKDMKIGKCQLNIPNFLNSDISEDFIRVDCYGKDKKQSKCVLIITAHTSIVKMSKTDLKMLSGKKADDEKQQGDSKDTKSNDLTKSEKYSSESATDMSDITLSVSELTTSGDYLTETEEFFDTKNDQENINNSNIIVKSKSANKSEVKFKLDSRMNECSDLDGSSRKNDAENNEMMDRSANEMNRNTSKKLVPKTITENYSGIAEITQQDDKTNDQLGDISTDEDVTESRRGKFKKMLSSMKETSFILKGTEKMLKIKNNSELVSSKSTIGVINDNKSVKFSDSVATKKRRDEPILVDDNEGAPSNMLESVDNREPDDDDDDDSEDEVNAQRIRLVEQQEDEKVKKSEYDKLKQDLIGEREKSANLKRELRGLELKLESFKSENECIKRSRTGSQSYMEEISILQDRIKMLQDENLQMKEYEEKVRNDSCEIESLERRISELEKENSLLRRTDSKVKFTKNGKNRSVISHGELNNNIPPEVADEEDSESQRASTEQKNYVKAKLMTTLFKKKSKVDLNIKHLNKKNPKIGRPKNYSKDFENIDPRILSKSCKRVEGSTLYSETFQNIDAFEMEISDNEKELHFKDMINHLIEVDKKFYNCRWEYENKNNLAAIELAQYLIKSGIISFQKERHNQSLLLHIINSIFGQIMKFYANLEVLTGIFQWIRSFISYLLQDSYIFGKLLPQNRIKWIGDIEKTGIIVRFESPADMYAAIEEEDISKAWGELVIDSSPIDAFFDYLDRMASFTYGFMFVSIYSVFNEAELANTFFGQTRGLYGTDSRKMKRVISKSSNQAENTSGDDNMLNNSKNIDSLLSHLDTFVSIFRTHFLSPVIESQFLAQFFYWCSSVAVNKLVNSPERCSVTTAMSLKISISYLSQWIFSNSYRPLSDSIERQFRPIHEAANALSIDKNFFNDLDAFSSIFSVLNVAQVYKLLSQFQPDHFESSTVPVHILDTMKDYVFKTNAKVTYLDGTSFLCLSDGIFNFSVL